MSDKEASEQPEKDLPSVLVCNRECDMPGVGAWNVGDKVTDPELIKRLNGHPFFDIKEGE